jgi:hypothetical protein
MKSTRIGRAKPAMGMILIKILIIDTGDGFLCESPPPVIEKRFFN